MTGTLLLATGVLSWVNTRKLKGLVPNFSVNIHTSWTFGLGHRLDIAILLMLVQYG
jgi:hypothetical protein